MKFDEERLSKRRRLNDDGTPQTEITSVNQLNQSLHFRNTISSDVKAAVNQFKDFLSQITRNDNVAAQSAQLQVLRQYCTAQTASSRDEIDFPDLLSLWSYAAQSNNDPICSAVPAVLAQFYKTISGFLEFREFGLSLGHTLLKRDQVGLIARGLSASKSKEHLISPCLRLLTEVISFDGGALASRVYDRRDAFYKRLDFLLDQQDDGVEEDRRKATVRRMALRLLIANLKFLDTTAKAELFSHGRILRNCLRGLMTDGDDIVVDVLRSIEAGLANDKGMSKLAKNLIFSRDNLTSLITLYNYELDPAFPESDSRVRDAVHKLLLQVCTTRLGILVPQTGWYPIAYDKVINIGSDDRYIDLGLDSPTQLDAYHSNIPVKNSTLSTISQALKPEDDTLQSALLLQILRSAPELVADYFSRKGKFTSTASEDPAWRSQFAFLFSVSQLPIPRSFGWPDDDIPGPPPVPIMIESLVPRPLDRTTLSKYFTSNDEVLILSAARLLVVALEKLTTILKRFAQRTNSIEWQQACTGLVEALLARLPKLQEIINALQRTGKESEAVRLALFECLAIYHRVLPEAVAGSKFDIGVTLANSLSQYDAQATSELKQTSDQQILHMVTIAYRSTATKWWSKVDSESFSLFTQILRFAIEQVESETASELFNVLSSVSSSAGFLSTDALSFTALQLSLTSTKKYKTGHEAWLVLDNAIQKAVQRPVKYLDRIESAQQTVSDKKALSLLAAAVAEQWEFVQKKYVGQKDVLKNVSEWTTRFYSALESAGENFRVMQQFQDEMLQVSHEKAKDILQRAVEKGHQKPMAVEKIADRSEQQAESLHANTVSHGTNLEEILGMPMIQEHSLEGVDHWNINTDIELAVQSGKVGKLLHCTCSAEDEIRRQSLQSLQSFTHIVDQSNYNEKTQLYLLLGEVIQTIKQNGLQTPLPSIAVTLATRLLHMISDPADQMYGKVNKFLLRSPVWDLKRLISYWTREILFQEPESDDVGSWTGETEWFLRLLIDGLQNSSDMEMYRRSGIYEKILALYVKPNLSKSMRRAILTLIWRGVCVDGSNTLITRVGIQDWLHVASSVDKDHSNIISQLGNEVRKRSDINQIKAWMEDLPVLRDVVDKTN